MTGYDITSSYGYQEGDRCNRDGGCSGVIELHPVENCSCHLSAPCNACTSPRAFCPECGWEESEDVETFTMNGFNIVSDKGVWVKWERRPLDPTKIDWHTYSHSSCSMLIRGVYPPGTSSSEVQKLVDGTFGGRFTHFANGKFEFIAYTD